MNRLPTAKPQRHLSVIGLSLCFFAIGGCASQGQQQGQQMLTELADLKQQMSEISRNVQILQHGTQQHEQSLEAIASSAGNLQAKLQGVETVVTAQGDQTRQALKTELALMTGRESKGDEMMASIGTIGTQ